MNGDSVSPTRGARRALTGPLRWVAAVADAALPSNQKLALYALGRNLNFRSWQARPSKGTWARAAGFRSIRTLDAAVFSLENIGVLQRAAVSKRGRRSDGRGITNTYEVDIVTLEGLNPATGAGLNPANNDSKPRNPRQTTPQGLRANRPSIHDRPSEQTIHASEPKPMDNRARQAAWMDGQTDARRVLAGLGVTGPNLNIIADAPGITPEVIKREWEQICRDSHVRKRTAVLVTRLNKQFHLGIRGRPSASRHALDANDQLRRLRTLRGRS